jgi:urocanate hydratase
VDEILRSAMLWDVIGGVARRSWARNEHSIETIIEFNRDYAGKAHVTIPYIPTEELIDNIVTAAFQ